MKKSLLSLIVFSCSLLTPLALAADKPQAPVPSQVDAKEMEFNRKAQEFYKSHIEYYKNLQEKRKGLQQQIMDANKELLSTKDEKKKKALQEKIAAAQNQLLDLSEDAAKHEIESSEFGIKMAQHRLELAQKNLARIQAQKKK